MKPIDVILLAPRDDRPGRLRHQVLEGLLDRLSTLRSSAPGGRPAVRVRVAADDSLDALEAHSKSWIIASPAAHPQVMEAARRFPQRMMLLADLATPLTSEQDSFWKTQVNRLAAIAAVSQCERQEIARRWDLDRDSVIRLGLGLDDRNGEEEGTAAEDLQDFREEQGERAPPGDAARPAQGGASPRETEEPEAAALADEGVAAPRHPPFQLDLLQSWSRGRAVVIEAWHDLRRELCFEADGGVVVPAGLSQEAQGYLRRHPASARQLGLQGRLYVASRHHPRSSAQALLRTLSAIPARRGLAGRRVALYTPSFLPYDAVSNYVAETCRLLRRWGVEFSLHVQDHLQREDFASHLRPASAPDPRADIEIYNYPGYYPAVERLRQASQGPLRIFDYHGVTPSSLWPDDSLSQSEKEIRLAALADFVFTHSRFSQEFLRQEHGVLPEKMIRFPYSVDLSAFSPRPADRQLLSGYRLETTRPLLYVGRMAPNKRIDVLVEGLARLPDDCALILAGDYTYPLYARQAEAARDLAQRLGVGSRVVFTGSVSDGELRGLFNSAHLFVSASLHEGFGIPFIEAMACGLPSLGTHAASIPEVIGEAGRTFSPADSDDFARQALTLLEDDA
ncbi:MAG TPA: glycosyltransferase, partial [Acidobacteriota bacterium]|nr:glycosyltransferase [Acidobacteriota bacterium]